MKKEVTLFLVVALANSFQLYGGPDKEKSKEQITLSKADKQELKAHLSQLVNGAVKGKIGAQLTSLSQKLDAARISQTPRISTQQDLDDLAKQSALYDILNKLGHQPLATQAAVQQLSYKLDTNTSVTKYDLHTILTRVENTINKQRPLSWKDRISDPYFMGLTVYVASYFVYSWLQGGS